MSHSPPFKDFHKWTKNKKHKEQNGKINGFALHFDADVWLITLKDYNNSYCYITIKDPTGIGSSVDTIGEFLSSLTFAN